MTEATTTKNSYYKGGAIVKSNDKMGFHQMMDDESCTYTYLLWDPVSKDAIIVDPVDIQVDRDLSMVQELGLNLVFGVNTHMHADHITGTGLLKQRLGGPSSNFQSVISQASGAQADIQLSHGDRIVFGSRFVEARATPGHTTGCMCYVADDKSFVLTGDTLLIQGCGRTDFQGGSAATLYEGIYNQLFTLPETTLVYPGHDYQQRTCSTIGDELQSNPRLGKDKTKDEFIDIMNNLNLAYPKKIDASLPANKCDGIVAAAAE